MFNNILNWENIYSFCAIHSYFESVTCDCLKLCWTQALNIVKHRLHVCWGVMYRVWIPGAALTMWPDQQSTWAMPGPGDATLTSVTPHFTTRTAWITDSLITLYQTILSNADTRTDHTYRCLTFWHMQSSRIKPKLHYMYCLALVSTQPKCLPTSLQGGASLYVDQVFPGSIWQRNR